jgi:hypothetical protein
MCNHTMKYVKILLSNPTEREATWNWSQQCSTSIRIFFTPISSIWSMFHPSFISSVGEAVEFENEFFLGKENVPP